MIVPKQLMHDYIIREKLNLTITHLIKTFEKLRLTSTINKSMDTTYNYEL